MTDEQVEQIVQLLKNKYKKFTGESVQTSLKKNTDPFKVLISTILSLRTKDEITYPTAEKLFALAKTPKEILKLKTTKLEKVIKPVGFYHVKAKNIRQISKEIVEKYDGKVPNSREKLLKFKGVGRKTANLVLSVCFKKYTICVDTHVHRISNRLGLVRTKNPSQTELELENVIPKKFWREINLLLVRFGQNVCKPIKPKCEICKIKKYCQYFAEKK